MRFRERAQSGLNWLAALPWPRIGIITSLVLVVGLIAVQLLYPADRLLPLQNIDNVAVGAKTRAEAAQTLNGDYSRRTLAVYLGDKPDPVSTPTLDQAGIVVDNTARINAAQYPLWLRFVPASLFWANSAGSPPAATSSAKTDEFISGLLKQRQVAPQDATLKANGDKLEVVPAKDGGECDPQTVKQELAAITPSLTKPVTARISMKILKPAVQDDVAKASAEQYMAQVKLGVTLNVSGQNVVLAPADVYSWLDFTPSANKVEVSVSTSKAKDYMDKNIAPKVAVAPSTITITTLDFAEVSRSGGGNGQALDIDKTTAAINAVLHGTGSTAMAATMVVPANISYIRTYSSTDEGLNALFKNYATDHPGTFGISYAELYGDRRFASYQGDKQFVTASTYKLFVAYSVLKRVEAGQMSWDDNQACFNKMISLSDNACAEAFLYSVGLKNVTNDIHSLGLMDSNFTTTGGPFTTADDLVVYLGTLESGTMFSDLSRQRLTNAMLGNVYRQGIPAGASGQVADKVGFMDGLLHDAAIVYGPKGTYVLAVMTDGSSWSAIADLTRQLEQIR